MRENLSSLRSSWNWYQLDDLTFDKGQRFLSNVLIMVAMVNAMWMINMPIYHRTYTIYNIMCYPYFCINHFTTTAMLLYWNDKTKWKRTIKSVCADACMVFTSYSTPLWEKCRHIHMLWTVMGKTTTKIDWKHRQQQQQQQQWQQQQ